MNHHFITFNKDEIIFLEGQSSNCACIIESGKVGIFRKDSLGNRFLVRKLSKTAIAQQNTRCMIIERSRFDYLTKFNPHFMVSLIKLLTEGLRTTIAKLNKAQPLRKNRVAIKTTVSDFYDIKGE